MGSGNPMVISMGTASKKKKFFDTGFQIQDLAGLPVFNFFKSCLNSARPDWGSPIVNFKIPGRLRGTNRVTPHSTIICFRKG